MNRRAMRNDQFAEGESCASSRFDVMILFPVLILVGIGIVMVYSASSALALKKFGSEWYFFNKQLVFSFMGAGVLIAAAYFPLKLLRALTYPLLCLVFVFLVAVQIPGCGLSAGGATRWLRLGSFSFQPSEIARFAVIVYMAYSMTKKQDKIGEFSIGFAPHAIVFCLFTMLIILQPDFGSVVILGALMWIMMFIGGVRLKHLVLSVLASVPVIWYFVSSASYRIERIISFWDPWQYAADGGYQIIHSLMAFGTGGIFGTGVGQGYQKLFYLPEPHTDFIFSVIGEELGLLGVLFILMMYTLILWKGCKIAKDAADSFNSFLAVGIVTALGLQVAVNMGVAMALLPTKGLTLPFLSYGGTSLLLSMASMGLLMNIGASVKK